MKCLMFLLAVQGAQVSAASYKCVDSKLGNKGSLVSLNLNADNTGSVKIKVPTGVLKGQHAGDCFEPDPSHSAPGSGPYLKCSIESVDNSGFTLFVYGNYLGIERVEGSSWNKGEILPGRIELDKCEEVN